MTDTRTLDSPPGTIGLYLRAAAASLPLASRLPFVAGGGGEIPDTELVLEDVEMDREHLAEYARVCELPVGDELPATYPAVLAFPMFMSLMTDGSFPLPAVGLVHIDNTIVQHRPIDAGERLELRVRATPLAPHPKGRAFTIVTEVRSGGELVWEGRNTELRRGRDDDSADALVVSAYEGPTQAEWRLAGDLGRRYGAVSGDRNPIHIHDLAAKPFGYRRAIAHGMWTKARCLAALDPRLPDAFTVEVAFRRPIFLPSKVEFGSEPGDEATTVFGVRNAKGDRHLDGVLRPA